jgi:hypothetical protein
MQHLRRQQIEFQIKRQLDNNNAYSFSYMVSALRKCHEALSVGVSHRMQLCFVAERESDNHTVDYNGRASLNSRNQGTRDILRSLPQSTIFTPHHTRHECCTQPRNAIQERKIAAGAFEIRGANPLPQPSLSERRETKKS